MITAAALAPYLPSKAKPLPHRVTCGRGYVIICWQYFVLHLSRYEGPLCGICKFGYYKMLSMCIRCPSTKWIIGQSVVCFLLLVALFVFLWWSGKRTARNSNRKVRDVFLGNMKIVVGFFQVTAGIMEAFQYVQWPAYLENITRIAELVQLNALQISPVSCIDHSMRMTVFQNMILMLGVNASIFVIAAFMYLLVYGFLCIRRVSSEDRQAMLSDTRVTLYRYSIVILFIIFPGTCSNISRSIPCHRICQSKNKTVCHTYLRGDYSVFCDEAYKEKKEIACYALSYLAFFPVLAFVYLFKHFKFRGPKVEDKPTRMQEDSEITAHTPDAQFIVRGNSPVNDKNRCSKLSENTKELSSPQNNVPNEVNDIDTVSMGIGQSLEKIKLEPVAENCGGILDDDTDQISQKSGRDEDIPEPELLQAMSFIYENFKSKIWFWEFLETIRKIILVSCLFLIGDTSRAFVALGAVISGLYAVLFARLRPMYDGFEHRLQMLSLTVTFANLATAVVMKIPTEPNTYASDPYLDNTVVDMLLVSINASVVLAITGMFWSKPCICCKQVAEKPRREHLKCMHVCMYACMCVCTYVCIYIYIYICVCIYACTYVCM